MTKGLHLLALYAAAVLAPTEGRDQTLVITLHMHGGHSILTPMPLSCHSTLSSAK